MGTEEELNKRVDELIDFLRSTCEYKEYVHASKVLDLSPDIKEKVYAFREENYFLQHLPSSEDIYEKVEQLRLKNEQLLNMPDVNDFLMTEWEFFSLMQGMFDRIMDNMDF